MQIPVMVAARANVGLSKCVNPIYQVDTHSLDTNRDKNLDQPSLYIQAALIGLSWAKGPVLRRETVDEFHTGRNFW